MRSIEATKRAARNYFLRNRDNPEFKAKRLKWTREWRRANPDFMMKFSYRYAVLKAKAKHRNQEMTLSLDEYRQLIDGKHCEYCGILVFSTCTGIDRVDSAKGYVSGNCVPCCYRCNVMKADLSLEEFYAQVERIVDHRAK